MIINKPEPFLHIRNHKLDVTGDVCGLCVGYENSEWRSKQFADHIIEWLPEFALTASEWKMLNHSNAVSFIRRAAAAVYETEKFKNRGEFGELFLHAAIRQVYNSIPAISKIYYKTALNDTVKGFDAVHVVGDPDSMELWLGEAKFYSDINAAVRDVVRELEDHLSTDYLRTEFSLIMGKIDDTLPHAPALKHLISKNTSLDHIFKRICIPVLLTYESQCVSDHKECDETYAQAFSIEIQKHHGAFLKAIQEKGLSPSIRIHLFLLPLSNKNQLVQDLDEKLKQWQKI